MRCMLCSRKLLRVCGQLTSAAYERSNVAKPPLGSSEIIQYVKAANFNTAGLCQTQRGRAVRLGRCFEAKEQAKSWRIPSQNIAADKPGEVGGRR